MLFLKMDNLYSKGIGLLFVSNNCFGFETENWGTGRLF